MASSALDALINDDGTVDHAYLVPVGFCANALLYACRPPGHGSNHLLAVALDNGAVTSLVNAASLQTLFGPVMPEKVVLPVGRFLRTHREAFEALWTGDLDEAEFGRRLALTVE